jgi:hypothetical protein
LLFSSLILGIYFAVARVAVSCAIDGESIDDVVVLAGTMGAEKAGPEFEQQFFLRHFTTLSSQTNTIIQYNKAAHMNGIWVSAFCLSYSISIAIIEESHLERRVCTV